MRGHVRVRTAPFCPAPLVVPPLADGFRAGVRDKMVIDVVHVRDHRVRGEHRRREHPLQLQRVGPVRDRGQAGPQSPQGGQRDEPGQRPGLGRGQVLERLRRRGTQREACADRRQQRYVPRRGILPGCGGEYVPGPGPGGERVQQHRPRVPRPYRPRGRPAVPRHEPGRRPRLRHRLRLRGSGCSRGSGAVCAFPPYPAFRPRFRPVVRQRVLHVRPAQAAQHRGLVHPQPPRDLRVPHPGGPPLPRPVPRRFAGLPRP